MVYETKEVELSLRRYRGPSEGGGCSVNEMGYHNESVPIERAPANWHIEKDGTRYLNFYSVEEHSNDPRWPKQCVCGYEFLDSDPKQVNPELIYADTHGNEWPQRALPAGAMFEVWWMSMCGPDGKCLAVVLPPARPRHLKDVWIIDGPSSSGGRWVRTGTPPNITASPSILSDRYHGFLQNGKLTDSLGDRPMPPGPDK